MKNQQVVKNRAQQSRAAIERIYIAMRHLFIRGTYKPLGVSGEGMIESLKTLKPEIYGSISDPERVELNGLIYVMQRLPKGIEECRLIRMVSGEGIEHSGIECIIPSKRRRNAYRIDREQMYIELTRGRSDIYDILTHLTFLYVESEKIRNNAEDHKKRKTRDWKKLEEIVINLHESEEEFDHGVGFTYLSTVLGRTYDEVKSAFARFDSDSEVNSLFHITYWLGRLAMEEDEGGSEMDRQISFSSQLRETIGMHVHGEIWANTIKNYLYENDLSKRPVHIISANLHSVLNTLFAKSALGAKYHGMPLAGVAQAISHSDDLEDKIIAFAKTHGMHVLGNNNGTNIGVQIFDTAKVDLSKLPKELKYDEKVMKENQPVIVVMDYAFGEQAYEVMDELLKPLGDKSLNIQSVGIMGKAGILCGGKGDLMVPNAHIFEGTADNYPFENALKKEDFVGQGLEVIEGPMITVLGTSLQNKDILKFFKNSSWKAIGLEMEGAHYQKAIQAASKIRKTVDPNINLQYAYYASDNPLLTGHTLASGGLGDDGVKPTYLITVKILSNILTAFAES